MTCVVLCDSIRAQGREFELLQEKLESESENVT